MTPRPLIADGLQHEPAELDGEPEALACRLLLERHPALLDFVRRKYAECTQALREEGVTQRLHDAEYAAADQLLVNVQNHARTQVGARVPSIRRPSESLHY